MTITVLTAALLSKDEAMCERREVISFDRGGGFAVGNYELAKIPPASRLGVRPNRHDDNANHDNRPKRVRHLTTNVRSVLGGKKPDGE